MSNLLFGLYRKIFIAWGEEIHQCQKHGIMELQKQSAINSHNWCSHCVPQIKCKPNFNSKYVKKQFGLKLGYIYMLRLWMMWATLLLR